MRRFFLGNVVPVTWIIRTRLPIVAGLLAALFFAPREAHAQRAPIVKTQAGDVQGVAERNVFAFKGIPFAAPPVGAFRWREPRPAASWQGVRTADDYGNACIQGPGLSEANGGYPGSLSEDCLYLTYGRPSSTPRPSFPCVVWIHGGAYVFGSGSAQLSTMAHRQLDERCGGYHHQLPSRAARFFRPSSAGEGKSLAARQTSACSIRSPRSNG